MVSAINFEFMVITYLQALLDCLMKIALFFYIHNDRVFIVINWLVFGMFSGPAQALGPFILEKLVRKGI